MKKFEITMGDARFVVSIPSRSQNHFNTPINSPHFHIDREIHIVLDGEGVMEINGVTMPMRAGDVHIIPRNASHDYKHHNAEFNKISFFYTLSRIGEGNQEFSEYSYYSEIFNFIDEWITLNDRHLTGIGRELLSLEFSPKNDHIHRSLYAIFFITLARLIENRTSLSRNKKEYNAHENKDSQEQKMIIESFFFKRFGENVTIEDLARELYKSVPQTHRIVKRYFNDSFKTILVKQRMEQACMLVRQGGSKLGDISFACGYNSYNGFLEAFKKYTGKTPEEYKKAVNSRQQNNNRLQNKRFV